MPTSKKLHVTLLYIYEYAELSDSLFFEAGIDSLDLYRKKRRKRLLPLYIIAERPCSCAVYSLCT